MTLTMNGGKWKQNFVFMDTHLFTDYKIQIATHTRTKK